MVWYPNRSQWVVIWVATSLSSFLWIIDAPSPGRLAGVIVVIGALLVWRLSVPPHEASKRPVEVVEASKRPVDGLPLPDDSKRCPRCGLLNPGNSQHCDCSFDFRTATASQPLPSTGTEKALAGIGLPSVAAFAVVRAMRTETDLAARGKIVLVAVLLTAAIEILRRRVRSGKERGVEERVARYRAALAAKGGPLK